MLKKLKTLIAGETSADIEAAIVSIDTAAMQATLADAHKRRADALLDGSGNTEILAIEREIDNARLDLERAEIQRETLARRLDEALVRERSQNFWRKHAEATAARDALVAKLDREYAKGAKIILDLVEEGRASDALIAALTAEIIVGVNDPTHPMHEREGSMLQTADQVFWGGRFFSGYGLSETSLLPTSTTPCTGFLAGRPRNAEGRWVNIAH